MAMERYNPTARASSRQMPSNGATPGNLGQGDPVNGYPFGSTTPGYIDYRDPSVNGAFYPGTTRQRYQDDPNARKVHTPGSDRHSQEENTLGARSGASVLRGRRLSGTLGSTTSSTRATCSASGNCLRAMTRTRRRRRRVT